MGFWGQQNTVVEKLHAVRLNAAVLGVPIPIMFGQNRLTARLIWYNDFTANKAKQQGGKGLGKGGSQYVYTASVMAALCFGPVSSLNSVWDNTGRFVVESVSENYTVGAPSYKYTPAYAAALAADQGVGAQTAYSYGVNDYGSTGPTTLSGTTLVGYTAVSAPPAYSDNFNRANGSLGSNWTVIEGTWAITSDTAWATAVGSQSDAGAYYNGSPLADCYSQVTVVALPVGGTYAGPAVRMSQGTGSTINGYGFYVTGTTWYLIKQVNGVHTNLATGSHTLASSDVLYIQAQGTTISAQINGSQVASVTDSTYTSGYQGMVYQFGSASTTMDAWQGGGIGGASLASGTYYVDAEGSYYFSSADSGKTVQISYGFYRYVLTTDELSIVPFSAPYHVVVQNAAVFKTDQGVSYYPSGIALTSVAGTPSAGQYHYAGSGVYNFAAADSGQGIVIHYEYADPNTDVNAPQHLNLTLITGQQFQTPWSYLTSNHASQALGYTQLAMIASSGLYMGYSPELPNYNYEIAGPYQCGSGIVDANPADCITQILTNAAYGIGFPAANLGPLTAARTCWTANSFFISPLIENQNTASSVIKPWLEAGMVAGFWSEGLLKFVPYCDTSAVGNGVLYQPSTNPVVAITFTDSMYIGGSSNEDPLTVTRTQWMDAYNRVYVTYNARVNDYNPETIYEQDEGSVQKLQALGYGDGLRPEDPSSWDFIMTLTSAQYAASMRLQRYVYIRNTYEFSLSTSYSYLEPMDVITITDSILGLTNYPVRIQKIEDDPQTGLKITAEDFIYGAAAPAYNPKQTNAPPPPLPGQEDPGMTSAIIFEAPSRLGLQAGNMLYGFLNGENTNWGGCHVWISYDGTNFELMPGLTNGAVNFPARIGTLTGNLPAYGGSNPDNGDTLSVQMTDDNPLSSTTADGAANNVSLSAVVSSNASFSPTLELLSYETATLTAENTYNLTTLYRGIYGTSAELHYTGDLFCRLDEASFQLQFDPTYIGKTIYYKFTSFNLLGQNEQDISEVPTYSFTLQGTTGAIALDTGFINSSAPGYTAYRPLSNPLTAIDAGGSATINIAAFIMAMSGPSAQVQVSENSGVITGLNYSTTYFVYFDDPTVSGGAVSYQVTTTREVVYQNMTRFFVGSIGTPVSGGGTTYGNNDGGAGGQYAKTMKNLPTSYATSGSGTFSNPGNAIDNDPGTFMEMDSSAANLVYTASGFASFGSWFTQNVLQVISYVPAVSNGSVYIDYSTDGGSTWTNLRTVSSADTQLMTSTVNLPLSIPTQNVQVRITAPGGSTQSSSGPDYAGTGADDSSTGSVSWTNPSNATGNNTSSSADASYNTGSSNANTHYLKLTNFGFAISSGATITGISVTILRESNAESGVTGSPPKAYALKITDNLIKLYKAGTLTGSGKATSGNWPTTPGYITYGGTTDLWGGTWLYSDINNSGFGVGISANLLNSGVASGAAGYVYQAAITVYYTVGGSASSTTQIYDISAQVTT